MRSNGGISDCLLRRGRRPPGSRWSRSAPARRSRRGRNHEALGLEHARGPSYIVDPHQHAGDRAQQHPPSVLPVLLGNADRTGPIPRNTTRTGTRASPASDEGGRSLSVHSKTVMPEGSLERPRSVVLTGPGSPKSGPSIRELYSKSLRDRQRPSNLTG
jgi:hypothetical protein